jgi:hypothetical protein
LPALFRFPNPVNEVSARTVAAGVVVLCLLTLGTRSPWLLGLLAYGFLARVATGPTLSPLGQFAVKVAPRVILARPRYVPGPPKRFAQGIGATLSTSAFVAYLLGAPTISWVLVAMILAAATLESVFAYCVGCVIFGFLQRNGVIPASVCEACLDVRTRASA